MKTTTRPNQIEQPESGHASRSLITFAAMIFIALAGVNRVSGENVEEHIAALRKKLPAQTFTIVRQAPFVVIGDDTPESVKLYAEKVVKWAVDRLKQDYFAKDPEEIINIWL